MKKNLRHYQVVIEQDENGTFVGTVLGLKSCYSDGKSIDVLLKNLEEAIEVCERVSRKDGVFPERNHFVGVRDLIFGNA